MRVYIVWVKGKKVTLKNPPGKMFCDYLEGRPYSRDSHETNSLAIQLPVMCFSHALIVRTLLVKCTGLHFILDSSPT